MRGAHALSFPAFIGNESANALRKCHRDEYIALRNTAIYSQAPMRALLITFLLLQACTPTNDTPATAEATDQGYILTSTFIYDEAPFPSAHASTVVETPEGIAAAWFGGTEEKDPDVGIWFALNDGNGWSEPIEVADGVVEGTEYACWNPVLFQPEGGPLVLFYKVGVSPREWWGAVRTSDDNGKTWSDEVTLPEGVLGPIRAKPVLMADGSLLAGSSTEHDGWVVHMERLKKPASGESMWSLDYLASPDSWDIVGDLNDPDAFDAIQPTILVHSPDRLQILCRSQQDVISQAFSEDGGKTWGPMTASELPNPSAGVDAVNLADGRFLLVYNPTTQGRRQLALAVSDDGMTWNQVALLEDAEGEYSYPAMIQDNAGTIHITYTWRREKVKYVEVDLTRLI